jgi:hypothetical protein
VDFHHLLPAGLPAHCHRNLSLHDFCARRFWADTAPTVVASGTTAIDVLRT